MVCTHENLEPHPMSEAFVLFNGVSGVAICASEKCQKLLPIGDGEEKDKGEKGETPQFSEDYGLEVAEGDDPSDEA